MSRLPLLLATLVGCDQIVDTYEGLTSPLVVEGMIIGVEAPESEDIDLSGTDYSEGTTMTLFLATAESVDNLEEAPVSGADVSLSGPGFGEFAALDVGAGVYAAGPDASLVYAANDVWTVSASFENDAGTADVTLPPPATVTVPEDHEPNTPITLALGGQGFTAALIVVLDTQTGDITYSTEPASIRDVYDLTRGNDDVGTVTVPGSAFPNESVYALGVAGLTHTRSADLDGLNSALSAVLAGKMRMFPVITADIPSK